MKYVYNIVVLRDGKVEHDTVFSNEIIDSDDVHSMRLAVNADKLGVMPMGVFYDVDDENDYTCPYFSYDFKKSEFISERPADIVIDNEVIEFDKQKEVAIDDKK